MKDKKSFIEIWNWLKNPPTYVKILTFLIAFITSISSIIVAICIDLENNVNVLAYIIFALAGISLAYAVFLIIPIIPKTKEYIVAFMNKRNFTKKLLENYGFRTIVFAICTFIFSIVFAGVNAYLGIKYKSIWFGALATYYILLAFMRGGILVFHQKKDKKEDENKQIKLYKNCGIVLLILNIALSSSIAQMIFDGAHFVYVGLTIFAYAAYAFFKITMSIINFVKANRGQSLTIQAIRNINLADAVVSILALQTALLNTFSEGDIDVSLMNTFTGIIVSAFTIGLGIYMIVKSRKLKKEKI